MDFSSILLIIMATAMLVGALKGLSRGIARQGMRSLTVIVSVVAALFITKGISNAFYTNFSSMTPEEFVVTIENAGIAVTGTDLEPILSNVSPETVSYILAIP